MHSSALKAGKAFFQIYAESLVDGIVVDLGSQDVNGTLKSVCPSKFQYLGVDLAEGPGVDIVLSDPYTLPFEPNSVDVIVCSSVLEHTEFYWLLFLEALRVLKPSGLMYINAPANGEMHRYPVDCWRFYPDAGSALVHWAHRNGFQALLLESFISEQDCDQWNDFVAVILKDRSLSSWYPRRILDNKTDFTNGKLAFFGDVLFKRRDSSEDQYRLAELTTTSNTLTAAISIFKYAHADSQLNSKNPKERSQQEQGSSDPRKTVDKTSENKLKMKSYLPTFSGLNKAMQKGRCIYEGSQRGWGLQFGDLRNAVLADDLYQAALSCAKDRTIMSEVNRMNIFLLMRFFLMQIPFGHIVEYGSYRGGNAIFMAFVAKQLYPGMKIFALDTYEGMPETDKNIDMHSKGDFGDADFESLAKYKEALGLDNLVLVKGLFETTNARVMKEAQNICLAHIDCDIAPAVRFSYEGVKPYMVEGGYYVFDDALVSSCLGATEVVEDIVIRRDGLSSEQVWPHYVFRAHRPDSTEVPS